MGRAPDFVVVPSYPLKLSTKSGPITSHHKPALYKMRRAVSFRDLEDQPRTDVSA